MLKQQTASKTNMHTLLPVTALYALYALETPSRFKVMATGTVDSSCSAYCDR